MKLAVAGTEARPTKKSRFAKAAIPGRLRRGRGLGCGAKYNRILI